MNVTILQTNVYWDNMEKNAQKAEELIQSCRHSDLYVLPEMWSTGFNVDNKPTIGDGNYELEWMKRIAEQYAAAIYGSVAIKDSEGHLRNRGLFVEPNGHYTIYDKRHLFSIANEDKYYTKGNKRRIVEWKGIRFLLAICYDLRFPVW